MQTSMSISQKQLQNIRRGGADRTLVKTVNLENPTSGTAKLPSQPASPLPREFTISFRMGSSTHNFIWPRGQSRHLPQSVSTSWGWFFPPLIMEWEVFHPIKGKAFLTSHHEGCQRFPRGPQSEGRAFTFPAHSKAVVPKPWTRNPVEHQSFHLFLKGPKKTPPVVSKGRVCILQ